MKRLAPYAALLVNALLAVQPALAATVCSSAAPVPCAPGCPMSMGSTAPDCPMTSGACPSGCCAVAVPQAVAPLALPERLTTPAHAALLHTLPLLAATSPRRAVRSAAPFVSPPLYLLHQVFRI